MEQQYTVRVRRVVAHEYDMVVTAESKTKAKKLAREMADERGDSMCPYTVFGNWRAVACVEGEQAVLR